MQKNSLKIIPALVGGIIAFFLRRRQLSVIFSSGTGLAARGKAISWILILFCAAFAVYTLLSAGRCRVSEKARPFGFGTAGKTLSLLAGLLLIVSGGFVAVVLGKREADVLILLLGIFALLAGLAAAGLGLWQKAGASLRSLFSAVPALFFCVWLIVFYRQNANDPALWSFGPQALAIAASALAWFYAAGYEFGKPDGKKTHFFCQLSVFLSVGIMADTLTLPVRAFLLCPALMLLLADVYLFLPRGAHADAGIPDAAPVQELSGTSEQELTGSPKQVLPETSDSEADKDK